MAARQVRTRSQVKANSSVFPGKKSNEKVFIGRRAGKIIRVNATRNSDGFGNVDDYFPDDSECSEAEVESENIPPEKTQSTKPPAKGKTPKLRQGQYIGRRTGALININARINSDGFANVDDYFPDSVLSSGGCRSVEGRSKSTVEISTPAEVHQQEDHDKTLEDDNQDSSTPTAVQPTTKEARDEASLADNGTAVADSITPAARDDNISPNLTGTAVKNAASSEPTPQFLGSKRRLFASTGDTPGAEQIPERLRQSTGVSHSEEGNNGKYTIVDVTEVTHSSDGSKDINVTEVTNKDEDDFQINVTDVTQRHEAGTEARRDGDSCVTEASLQPDEEEDVEVDVTEITHDEEMFNTDQREKVIDDVELSSNIEVTKVTEQQEDAESIVTADEEEEDECTDRRERVIEDAELSSNIEVIKVTEQEDDEEEESIVIADEEEESIAIADEEEECIVIANEEEEEECIVIANEEELEMEKYDNLKKKGRKPKKRAIEADSIIIDNDETENTFVTLGNRTKELKSVLASPAPVGESFMVDESVILEGTRHKAMSPEFGVSRASVSSTNTSIPNTSTMSRKEKIEKNQLEGGKKGRKSRVKKVKGQIKNTVMNETGNTTVTDDTGVRGTRRSTRIRTYQHVTDGVALDNTDDARKTNRKEGEPAAKTRKSHGRSVRGVDSEEQKGHLHASNETENDDETEDVQHDSEENNLPDVEASDNQSITNGDHRRDQSSNDDPLIANGEHLGNQTLNNTRSTRRSNFSNQNKSVVESNTNGRKTSRKSVNYSKESENERAKATVTSEDGSEDQEADGDDQEVGYDDDDQKDDDGDDDQKDDYDGDDYQEADDADQEEADGGDDHTDLHSTSLSRNQTLRSQNKTAENGDNLNNTKQRKTKLNTKNATINRTVISPVQNDKRSIRRSRVSNQNKSVVESNTNDMKTSRKSVNSSKESENTAKSTVTSEDGSEDQEADGDDQEADDDGGDGDQEANDDDQKDDYDDQKADYDDDQEETNDGDDHTDLRSTSLTRNQTLRSQNRTAENGDNLNGTKQRKTQVSTRNATVNKPVTSPVENEDHYISISVDASAVFSESNHSSDNSRGMRNISKANDGHNGRRATLLNDVPQIDNDTETSAFHSRSDNDSKLMKRSGRGRKSKNVTISEITAPDVGISEDAIGTSERVADQSSVLQTGRRKSGQPKGKKGNVGAAGSGSLPGGSSLQQSRRKCRRRNDKTLDENRNESDHNAVEDMTCIDSNGDVTENKEPSNMESIDNQSDDHVNDAEQSDEGDVPSDSNTKTTATSSILETKNSSIDIQNTSDQSKGKKKRKRNNRSCVVPKQLKRKPASKKKNTNKSANSGTSGSTSCDTASESEGKGKRKKKSSQGEQPNGSQLEDTSVNDDRNITDSDMEAVNDISSVVTEPDGGLDMETSALVHPRVASVPRDIAGGASSTPLLAIPPNYAVRKSILKNSNPRSTPSSVTDPKKRQVSIVTNRSFASDKEEDGNNTPNPTDPKNRRASVSFAPTPSFHLCPDDITTQEADESLNLDGLSFVTVGSNTFLSADNSFSPSSTCLSIPSSSGSSCGDSRLESDFSTSEVTISSAKRKEIEEDGEGDDSGMRRSKRTKVQPLKYWKNEKIKYGRRQSGWFVKGVETHPTPKVTKRKRRAPAKTKDKARKTSFSSSQSCGESFQEVFEVPEGMKEEINPSVTLTNPETKEEVMMDLFHTPGMLNFVNAARQPANSSDPLIVDKYMSHNVFGCGQLVLRAKAEKGKQNVRGDTMVFLVMKGHVEVTINSTAAVLSAGSTFFVPNGISYSIKNLQDNEARLFFVQVKG